MYIPRVVVFSLDESNLTRILPVFKENLVKYKGKRTSQTGRLFFSSSLISRSLFAHHRYFRIGHHVARCFQPVFYVSLTYMREIRAGGIALRANAIHLCSLFQLSIIIRILQVKPTY